MRPIKATFFFLYSLAALTAVGTAVSHLWRTSKMGRDEAVRISKPAADQPPVPAAQAS